MAQDRYITVGEYVTVRDRFIGEARRMFPAIETTTILKVTASYPSVKKCWMVVDKPGGEPKALWHQQLKLLPKGAPLPPIWTPAASAK